MFCKKCGAENPNDVKFCKECGTSMENSGGQKVSIPERKGISRKMLVGICAAAAVLVCGIAIVVGTGSSVDLNNYVTVEIEGYDGYGTARIDIDWEAFEKTYEEELAFTKKALNEYGALLVGITPADLIRENVSVKLDKSKNLSNGDTIRHSWNVDEDLTDYVQCRIKYKAADYEVSHLDEVGTVDVFKDLSVEFSGVAPLGKAHLIYTGADMKGDIFNCDKIQDLSNGDRIIVTVDEKKMAEYAEKYGKVPEKLQKEYQVEGLKKYIEKTAEIDEETWSSCRGIAAEVYQKLASIRSTEGESLESSVYLGNYFITAKDKNKEEDKNSLYLVYKLEIRDRYFYEGQLFDETNDVYWFVRYDNLMIDPNGKVDFDLYYYGTPEQHVTVDTGISDGRGGTRFWYHDGYKTLEELYQDVILSNSQAYEHEDHVEESSALTDTADSKPQELQMEVESNSGAGVGGYLFAYSSTVFLTPTDLAWLSAEECKLARNEIYARHGRKFNDKALQEYFDACEWYKGTIEPEAFSEADLNAVEKANLNLILERENELKNR